MSGLESTASRVVGLDFYAERKVLYVLAHAKKMRTNLLGFIQIRQKAAKFGAASSQYTFHVISLCESRAEQVSFT